MISSRIQSNIASALLQLPANLPYKNNNWGWPVFSIVPLLIVLIAKPLSDAFYETNSVKYGYMVLLAFSVFFASIGRSLNSPTRKLRDRDTSTLELIVVLIPVYAVYLFLVTYFNGGSIQDIFKILSPFVFFILVTIVADRWTSLAIFLSGAITIVVNAALLPTDFGWVYWGSVKTFKGYYYFKTDLAYALCFSLLFTSIWYRFKFTTPMVILLLLATLQIFLANSRMNYVILLVILGFLAIKNGRSLASLLRFTAIVVPLLATAILLYDSTKLLGFDFSNEGALTQGRSVIWDVLVNQGLANFSPAEWLFGRGLVADMVIFAKYVTSGEIHNAHNEWLHLIITQGIIGSAFYLSLWALVIKASSSKSLAWTKGAAGLAISIILLQSITGIVSLFATKTWPLIMIFLTLRQMEREKNETNKSSVR